MRRRSLARLLSRTAAGSLAAAMLFASAHGLGAQTSATPPASHGADQRYRYRIMGIYDEASGDPIEGVEVADVLSGLRSLTTSTGTVSLLFLPDGGSLVRLRKFGYEAQTFTVAISPADTAPLTVMLRKAVTLPTVIVNDSASPYASSLLTRAAERMNAHQGGYFIGAAEMRKHDNGIMSNTILSRLPGVTNVLGMHGEVYLRSSRQPCLHQTLKCSRPDCYVTVYRDGVKLFDPTVSSAAALIDFSRLSPIEFELVEFYPGGSAAPAEFGGLNAPCGVLLLWSRDR